MKRTLQIFGPAGIVAGSSEPSAALPRAARERNGAARSRYGGRPVMLTSGGLKAGTIAHAFLHAGAHSRATVSRKGTRSAWIVRQMRTRFRRYPSRTAAILAAGDRDAPEPCLHPRRSADLRHHQPRPAVRGHTGPGPADLADENFPDRSGASLLRPRRWTAARAHRHDRNVRD